MARVSSNGVRLDPYLNSKFRILIDGKTVAGVSKVSALKRTIEVVEHRSGGDPSTSYKMAGLAKHEPITAERGITHAVEFEQWANKAWNIRNDFGEEVSLDDFRKNIQLEMYNEAGQLVMRYNIYNAWVSEFQQTPELDAGASAIAIESIKIEHEGFVRDYDVTPPTEPAFTDPAQ
ncbi:phage tail region protein [Actibacterium atlanticum]|uniref:Phage tail region protein n=1 Tax=Actibacterium atlanticum TaxID=1461693 RepID=A0A058ZR20_9RHOB|nr:phage tail protein [Actibacterium atlanticum]KCV83670.1 phage tail region protein [Actibacterium atlanticum]